MQKEACTWAWELLTERLKLEKDRLYVTYFGGNKDAGLEPDLDTKNFWISLGYDTDFFSLDSQISRNK